jgi:hypothetical protein
VVTPEGKAKVVGHEVLAAQLLVETDDHRRKLVDLRDVTVASDPERPGTPRTNDATERPGNQ